MTAETPTAETLTTRHWEYRVLIFDAGGFKKNQFEHLEAETLNALGAEGWELISSDALAGEPKFGLPQTLRIALWFKRPLTG
jgi:hypothetical protein